MSGMFRRAHSLLPGPTCLQPSLPAHSETLAPNAPMVHGQLTAASTRRASRCPRARPPKPGCSRRGRFPRSRARRTVVCDPVGIESQFADFSASGGIIGRVSRVLEKELRQFLKLCARKGPSGSQTARRSSSKNSYRRPRPHRARRGGVQPGDVTSAEPHLPDSAAVARGAQEAAVLRNVEIRKISLRQPVAETAPRGSAVRRAVHADHVRDVDRVA
jgi:hypothetical protein